MIVLKNKRTAWLLIAVAVSALSLPGCGDDDASRADGSIDGSTDGSADGASTDGATVDGATVDGSPVDGSPADGSMDGSADGSTVHEADMNVSAGGVAIPNGTIGYDLGSSFAVGSDNDIVFTIANTGSDTLVLTQSPSVAVSGTGFTLQADASSPVEVSGSTTFTVRFSPTAAGPHSGSISIPNNDPDANPYEFTVSANAAAPEMDVSADGVSIPDGTSGLDLGSDFAAGFDHDIVFTIANTGSDTLVLSGSPRVSVSGAAFSLLVDASSPVAALGSTTFTLRFSPQEEGSYAGSISIASNDPDESPYDFTFGLAAVTPEMNVTEGGTGIPDGASGYHLGTGFVAGSDYDIVFTIANTGSSALALSGSPRVSVSGTGFSLLSDASTPVAALGSTTFTLRFAPSTAGPYSGSISITNNDLDENPYDFTVTATTVSQPNIIYDLNTAPGPEWTVGPVNCDWERGTVSNMGPVGAVCYGTNIDGYYGDDRTYNQNYVQLGPLDLSGFAAAAGFRLTFDAYFHLDYSYDFTQLQYSTNGTTFNAVTAAHVSGYPYNAGSGHPNEWSPNPSEPGHEPQWRNVVVDLGGMGLNGQTTVWFRWVLNSDPYIAGIQFPGFYIDNVDIGY